MFSLPIPRILHEAFEYSEIYPFILFSASLVILLAYLSREASFSRLFPALYFDDFDTILLAAEQRMAAIWS